MTTKKPVQRAVEVLVRDRMSGDSLKGLFYANDFGDGADEHVLDGHLTDARGVTRRFVGRLSGVRFTPMAKQGAPKKVARDVALFLAYRWFLGGESAPRAKSRARQAVMELWAARGFKGASEETHLRKRLHAGEKAAQGLSRLRVVTDGKPSVGHAEATLDGIVIAAPPDAFDVRPGELVAINGIGWYWRLGMEEAVQGRLSAGVPWVASKSTA
ncbi:MULTISPECIES: hypothetical protein [unclassified Acidovorax]|uniref:hypothetical protein n=1 Tax=unclassified Acidovorax TaxID=2684926 RepID=UPI001178070A|nr:MULTISPECIES: hypothetical protein [unclassified Acidovorax]